MEASLNEGAITLVNAGQPCLRVIFDLKAVLKKKKTDWRLEIGLGALQAFGLGGGRGQRAITLLTRRTWRPQGSADVEGAGNMIQIGENTYLCYFIFTLAIVLVLYPYDQPSLIVIFFTMYDDDPYPSSRTPSPFTINPLPPAFTFNLWPPLLTAHLPPSALAVTLHAQPLPLTLAIILHTLFFLPSTMTINLNHKP